MTANHKPVQGFDGNIFRFRDRATATLILDKIRELNVNIRIMHVCGTHQDTLVRSGLDAKLREAGVEIRQGPGCPVCVTTQREIEECVLLARGGSGETGMGRSAGRSKRIVAVFGDMMNVPGINGSLADWRANGCDIRIVYGIDDAVGIARACGPDTDVIFMAVGFETTAPATASAVLADPPRNFSVLCCHRTVPPALKAIIESGEVKLHGLIEPGHVSTIIGIEPYRFISENYGIPQVIAGFEPIDLLMGVYMLVRQVKEGRAEIENEYVRAVRPDGNLTARRVISEIFEPTDTAWRGFDMIPGSGLRLKQKYSDFDARKKFKDELEQLDAVEFKEPAGCRCGEVLRGVISSEQCPLIGKKCTPETPVGPCMVSAEGSCNIVYKYGDYRGKGARKR